MMPMGPFLSYSLSKYLITCLPIFTLILSDRCSLSSVARHSFQRWVLNSLTTPSTSLVVVLVAQVWNLGAHCLPCRELMASIQSYPYNNALLMNNMLIPPPTSDPCTPRSPPMARDMSPAPSQNLFWVNKNQMKIKSAFDYRSFIF